jgi:GT2 family glycosyltransferase
MNASTIASTTSTTPDTTSSEPNIAVIVPVLRRPQNVAPLVESFEATSRTSHLYFVADHDDVDELWAIYNTDHTPIINHSNVGTFAVKCNLGYRETYDSNEPWLLFIGDDVHFHDGWEEGAFREDDGSSFISTNDLSNKAVMEGRHATHPIIRRQWLDEHGASWDGPGTVTHQGYRHWYVDNEWTTVAQQAGEFRFAPDCKIEHMHPIYKKGADDAIYRLGQSHSKHDGELWKARIRSHLR